MIVVMKNLHLKDADAVNDQCPRHARARSGGGDSCELLSPGKRFRRHRVDGEVERLKANPSVALVAPDVLIRRTRHAQSAASARSASPSTSNPAAAAALELR